ncbi:hypothetical protein GCM10018779_47130 [Streptomyces griseocarneus]|nr:hypothetical protein GCM10018779_47130 [Streptomyces griseocarneus]
MTLPLEPKKNTTCARVRTCPSASSRSRSPGAVSPVPKRPLPLRAGGDPVARAADARGLPPRNSQKGA